MKILLFLIAAGVMYGQTVSGQTTSGTPPQTASFSVGFKKIPKLTMNLVCPGLPQDAAGNYLVVAGNPVSCTLSVNIAPSAATSIPVASSDTTQFTVPATVTIPQGALTSAAFNVTATP